MHGKNSISLMDMNMEMHNKCGIDKMSDDEADIKTTIGNVPISWYRDLPHIGYDFSGSKIFKPKSLNIIDQYLKKSDDPDYNRTIKSELTSSDVVLSRNDCNLIKNIASNQFVPGYNPYQPWVDIFSHETFKTSLFAAYPPKSHFTPPKWESIKVSKLVHAIKTGKIKTTVQLESERAKITKGKINNWCLLDVKPTLLWSDDNSVAAKSRDRLPAPPLDPPTHADSYRPPSEFQDPNIQYPKCLRHQNSNYDKLVKARFERCNSLYLYSRKRQLIIPKTFNADSLLPKLPPISSLRPFPHRLAIEYIGHIIDVTTVSISPCGQWLASGSSNGTVKIWDIITSRCCLTLNLSLTKSEQISAIKWNPVKSIILISTQSCIYLISHSFADNAIIQETKQFINDAKSNIDNYEFLNGYLWTLKDITHSCNECTFEVQCIVVTVNEVVLLDVDFHRNGDYFLSVCKTSERSKATVIHRLSGLKSQLPFNKIKATIISAKFHPNKPILIASSRRFVYMFNMKTQSFLKRYSTNLKWTCAFSVHANGNHVAVCGLDKKISWLDCEVSTKPFRTLRVHKRSVRSIHLHQKRPLMASGSDDGSVIIYHSKVSPNDYSEPIIIPLKVIHAESKVKACQFHKTAPWIFAGCFNGKVILYS
ncbi:hypothetical protein A3Q56_03632 [Intoshia linei]|uniref:BOP1 N-terminal domain-containing protein n=1 Tax=Intoshia linei TaxID=1819745 RepID=A0A177B319_9BILA|nr:hypothetical protein A3Q56_03632 [Intoshia linei]